MALNFMFQEWDQLVTTSKGKAALEPLAHTPGSTHNLVPRVSLLQSRLAERRDTLGTRLLHSLAPHSRPCPLLYLLLLALCAWRNISTCKCFYLSQGSRNTKPFFLVVAIMDKSLGTVCAFNVFHTCFNKILPSIRTPTPTPSP